jgi:hypothetical protein
MFFISPMQINLLGFKINAVDNASVVSVGSLQYIDQFVSYKRNQAVGEMNGDLAQLNLPMSAVLDPDLSDSLTAKNSAVYTPNADINPNRRSVLKAKP